VVASWFKVEIEGHYFGLYLGISCAAAAPQGPTRLEYLLFSGLFFDSIDVKLEIVFEFNW